MLFKLANLYEVFEERRDDYEDITKHHVYLLAGLRNMGYFQAHGIIGVFWPLLGRFNHSLNDMISNDREDNNNN